MEQVQGAGMCYLAVASGLGQLFRMLFFDR